MKLTLAVAMLAVMLSGSLAAAPAFWYTWRSKLDGQEFCAQVSPGNGWVKQAGPYSDARCETPRVVAR